MLVLEDGTVRAFGSNLDGQTAVPDLGGVKCVLDPRWVRLQRIKARVLAATLSEKQGPLPGLAAALIARFALGVPAPAIRAAPGVRLAEAARTDAHDPAAAAEAALAEAVVNRDAADERWAQDREQDIRDDRAFGLAPGQPLPEKTATAPVRLYRLPVMGCMGWSRDGAVDRHARMVAALDAHAVLQACREAYGDQAARADLTGSRIYVPAELLPAALTALETQPLERHDVLVTREYKGFVKEALQAVTPKWIKAYVNERRVAVVAQVTEAEVLRRQSAGPWETCTVKRIAVAASTGAAHGRRNPRA